MGTTFATIQIHNKEQIEPEQFVKTLSKYMKKKGLTSTTEEESQISYRIAFSGGSDWVTLSSTGYDIGSDTINSDIQGISKAMKACCIGTSVFDSDVVFLSLFDVKAKQKDMVALGRLEDMTDTEYSIGTGEEKIWSLLLTEKATWQRLTEIWNDEYVFAEEALAKMAPLWGMDSKLIVTDYQYWDELETNEASVIALHFETAQAMFISEGQTKLAFSMWTPAAMLSGIESVVSFYNIGSISKGLTVKIIGDCFEQDSVVIPEIKVEKCKNLNDFYGERIATTVNPVKEQLSDGRFGLAFELDDFEFIEGVNTEHPSVKSLSKKALDTLLSNSVFLRFTATIQSGSKHSFSFHVIPHTNWTEGQAGRTIDIYETQEQMYEERGGLNAFRTE